MPKYNSQELDTETGFYFYNARHYDPVICRFVTADSVIDGELSPMGWNRYMYVSGNPIVYMDPTGHWQDQSQKILYYRNGHSTLHEGVRVKGRVTKGDTLKKLAKYVLNEEFESFGTFSKEIQNYHIRKKIKEIKKINKLKSDTIIRGQFLNLGQVSKRIIHEKPVEQDSQVLETAMDIATLGGSTILRIGLKKGVAIVSKKMASTAMKRKLALQTAKKTIKKKAVETVRKTISDKAIKKHQLKFGTSKTKEYLEAFQTFFTPGIPDVNKINTLKKAAAGYAGYKAGEKLTE